MAAHLLGGGAPDYLFTSLASLAIKNPSVPSCILTWLPGLMRMLSIERNRHSVQINHPGVTLVHAHDWLIKRNGTHTWEVV